MQELLDDLYNDLDKEEDMLAKDIPTKLSPDNEPSFKQLFPALYRQRADGQPPRVLLVGPVGERPLHVFLLRAAGMEADLREGLLKAVKYL